MKNKIILTLILGMFLIVSLGSISADYLTINLGGTNSTLVSDTTPPQITQVYPTNTTYNFRQILFNIITDEKSSCNYSIDDFATNTSLLTDINGLTHFNSQTLSNENYVVKYSCSDIYDNLNITESTGFTIDYSSSSFSYSGSSDKDMYDRLTILESKVGTELEDELDEKINKEKKDIINQIISWAILFILIIIIIVLELIKRNNKSSSDKSSDKGKRNVGIKKMGLFALILFVFFISKYTFKEVLDVFNYIGRNLYPSHPQVGIFIVFVSIFFLIFFKEIRRFLKRITKN